VGIFEPWDLVYFQALAQTQFFMVLNKGIPVLRKFMLKNLQKIPFGEGQVQDPIPALPGHGFNRAHFFKNVL
jgi:hypothetical protein